jgi:hypothetical protein
MYLMGPNYTEIPRVFVNYIFHVIFLKLILRIDSGAYGCQIIK